MKTTLFYVDYLIAEYWEAMFVNGVLVALDERIHALVVLKIMERLNTRGMIIGGFRPIEVKSERLEIITQAEAYSVAEEIEDIQRATRAEKIMIGSKALGVVLPGRLGSISGVVAFNREAATMPTGTIETIESVILTAMRDQHNIVP